MHFSAGGQIDSNYDIFIFTKIVKLCIQKHWIDKILNCNTLFILF